MKSSSSSLFPVETQKFLQLQSQPQKFAHVAEIFKNIKEIVNNLIEKPKSHHVWFLNLVELNAHNAHYNFQFLNIKVTFVYEFNFFALMKLAWAQPPLVIL